MFSVQDFALHCSLLRELQAVLVCQDGPFALGSPGAFGGQTRSFAGEECSECRDRAATEQGSVLKEPFNY